jgi:ketosteroid isomerase-like protein
MSEENVEVVRRGYEAYERGDMDGTVADFAADCEYIAAGAVPGRTGTYLGPDGYKQFVAWLGEEFSDSHVQLDELLDADESVLVGATVRGRGRQSGIPATFTYWQVWIVENGKIVRGRGFNDRAEALEAAGLSE